MKLVNPFVNPDDKLGFSKVLDKYASHKKNGMDEFSDFLDPKSLSMFVAVLNKNHIKPVIFGGYKNSERNMLGFCTESTQAGFPITSLFITYNKHFSSPPSHRDYLGALIGLGIDRGKLGDICLVDGGAIVYVHSAIADFIQENFIKAGRTSVVAKINQNIQEMTDNGESKRITVSSLRLDAFVASAYNLSRTIANELIDKEKVFVNFRHEKKTHILKVCDKISVRGFGRVEINSVSGTTKKGKIALCITKY